MSDEPKKSKSLDTHPRDYYKQKEKEKAKLKAGKNGKKILDAAFDDMDKNPEVKKSELHDHFKKLGLPASAVDDMDISTWDRLHGDGNYREEMKASARKGKLVDFPVQDLTNTYMYHKDDFGDGYDQADEYAKNPKAFHEDPIIVTKHPDGTHHIQDGQHRFNHAYRNGDHSIKAFVFDSPSDKLRAPSPATELHKPKLKKSEWTNEPITLSKGSLQSRNKFDTRSPEVQQIASDQQKWTGSREDKATRGDLPRMEGAARVRALHKLHSKTQVRVNPSGEREFLMHRGVGNEERKNKNDDVNGKTNYTKFAVTSWSPHKHIAQRFAEYRSPNWQDPKDNIVSAWIPESSISHSVRQYNTHDASTYDGVKNKTIPKVGLKVGRDYNQRSEDEYIVDHSSGKHFDHHESMKRSDDAQKSERNNEPMSLAKTMTIGHAAGLENTKTGAAARQTAPTAPTAKPSKHEYTNKPMSTSDNSSKMKDRFAKIQAAKATKEKNPKNTLKSEIVKIPKKEFIAEHKKLINVLNSPSHKDDIKEAKEQKKELTKGQNGDWKKEGYSFQKHPSMVDMQSDRQWDDKHPKFKNSDYTPDLAHMVIAKDKNGKVAGEFLYQGKDNSLLHPRNVEVYGDHKRKGVATAMYNYAEKHHNSKIDSAGPQTKDGIAFRGSMKKSEWTNESTSLSKSIRDRAKEVLAKIDPSTDESWFFLDYDDSLAKSSKPTYAGQIHPEFHSGKPWVSKKSPLDGEIHWHANDKQAIEIDSKINRASLHRETIKHLKEPHLSTYNNLMNNLMKDPMRHFIPCEDNGKMKIRARHIKALLSASGTIRSDVSDPDLLNHNEQPRLDTTDPNHLIIHRISHSDGYNKGKLVSVKIPVVQPKAKQG